jgi:hypothetical protein
MQKLRKISKPHYYPTAEANLNLILIQLGQGRYLEAGTLAVEMFTFNYVTKCSVFRILNLRILITVLETLYRSELFGRRRSQA